MALQTTLLAGQKLSSLDNPILAFMTAFKNVHKYNIHLLLRGTKSFLFHVDPGNKILFTQVRFQYMLAVPELPFTVQILFATWIAFSKVYVVMVFILLLCTRVNPISFSVSLFIPFSFPPFLKPAVQWPSESSLCF